MKLTIEHLQKSFKDKIAVNDVSFTLEEGIHALLGANGSGKTTLMRMICGIMKPDQGIVKMDDIAILQNYKEYTKSLGYLPQNAGFYMDFNIESFLRYIGVLKCLKKDYCEQKIDELLTRLNLQDVRKKKLKHLSGGMMQRVGIAQALLNHPKILILDEPSAGLDPKERITLRQLLSHVGKDTIVILSTHIVSDVESIADDIMLMKQGKILFKKPLPDILQGMSEKVYEISGNEQAIRAYEQDYTIVNRKTDGNIITIRLLSDHKPCGQAIEKEPNLDDVYLSYFREENAYVETDLL